MLTLFIATVFLAANSVLIYLLIQSRTRVLVSKADWKALKSRALMLDLGDGGTFNQDELAVLKQVANEWVGIQPEPILSFTVNSPPPETWPTYEELKNSGQPGPVKVSNATVTVPPIPRPGQGAKI